jgi:lysophospholipase L1-like esterase
VVFDSEGRDARAVLRTSKRTVGRSASRIDLYYLAQPGGGELEVRVDGSEPTLVATEAPTPRAGFALLEVDDGPHEIIVEARPGKSVRVYGVSLERTEPGVIVHNLALGGSRARNHLKWRQPVYRQQLEHLAPDLVVFFYGGNEGNDFGVSLARYERNHARALTRFRSAAPEASCLMLGPADKPLRQGNRWVVRDRTVAIARIQERLARRFHCAYFDTLRFMGGPLAMRTWVEAGYARDDYVHFSAAGYRRLGEVLLESLLPSVRARRDEATGRLGRSPAEKRRREGADPHPR